jgi:hypothetical protein
MVVATRDGHVLHQFPYSEQLLSRSSEGWASELQTGGRPPRRSPAAN